MPSCPFRFTLASVVAVLLASPALRTQAQAPSPQLASVLAQMDAASKRFQNATASVDRDYYQHVIRDSTKEKATIFIQRAGGSEFGAAIYEIGADGKPATKPGKIIYYGGGSMKIYTPSEKQVDTFNAGANQTKLEGYFALGFGGSGHDLAQNWQITYGGPETLTDGKQAVTTEKLVLVSKDAGVLNSFKQVTLWIDPTRDISLKQVFETPSGDRQTAVYSNIHLNGKVNKDPYKIPTGKDIIVSAH